MNRTMIVKIVGIAAWAAFMTCASAHEQQHSHSAEGVAAASALLEAMPEQQRGKAVFELTALERLNWNFVPMSRAGVPLKELSPQAASLVDPLLRSALSASGFAIARAIIAHETLLGELERERNVFNWRRRDPGLYYTTVFGVPSEQAPWAWRFEGHHLSINVTELSGEKRIVAPMFMGANPARVPSGPKAGLRLLAAEEDLARELMRMLPLERRARALISEQAFSDILSRNDPKVSLKVDGLPASAMSLEERKQLRALVQVYSNRMTQSAASEQWARIEEADFGKLHFAWAGSLQSGEPHYYRVHGPTVLIEYDNTQNDANHVHSVWRDLQRDFGGDALRAHYQKHDHGRHAHAH